MIYDSLNTRITVLGYLTNSKLNYSKLFQIINYSAKGRINEYATV